MKKILKKMDWITPRGRWNTDEIIVDIFIMSMIFILGLFCSYIYYV